MGNVLDNACKYCLRFVEISARQTDEHLYIVVEDDGPGIPLSKRGHFDRGQQVDTLRLGQVWGWRYAEITEQYEGKIVAGEHDGRCADGGDFLVASILRRKMNKYIHTSRITLSIRYNRLQIPAMDA